MNAVTQGIAIGAGLLLLMACVPEAGGRAPSFQEQAGPGSEVPFSDPLAGNPENSASHGESGTIEGGSHSGGERGYVAPLDLLFCGDTGQIVLKKGQRTLLNWAYPDGFIPSAPLSFALETTPGGIANAGTMTSVTPLTAWYEAPAAIPTGFEVSVRATLGNSTTPAVCRIVLISDAEFGVEDDGLSRGAVGNVYVLPVNQPRLPNFAMMTPVSSILVPNFDVPQRSFDIGFPGVPDLFEWFGIRFEGTLEVPQAGSYQMRLNSDDGSILWIDDTKVIDNDGVHAPRTVAGTVSLTAGRHPFRLDYYQGPRYLIALQWFWKLPGESVFVLVPPDNILRPAN